MHTIMRYASGKRYAGPAPCSFPRGPSHDGKRGSRCAYYVVLAVPSSLPTAECGLVKKNKNQNVLSKINIFLKCGYASKKLVKKNVLIEFFIDIASRSKILPIVSSAAVRGMLDGRIQCSKVIRLCV